MLNSLKHLDSNCTRDLIIGTYDYTRLTNEPMLNTSRCPSSNSSSCFNHINNCFSQHLRVIFDIASNSLIASINTKGTIPTQTLRIQHILQRPRIISRLDQQHGCFQILNKVVGIKAFHIIVWKLLQACTYWVCCACHRQLRHVECVVSDYVCLCYWGYVVSQEYATVWHCVHTRANSVLHEMVWPHVSCDTSCWLSCYHYFFTIIKFVVLLQMIKQL